MTVIGAGRRGRYAGSGGPRRKKSANLISFIGPMRPKRRKRAKSVRRKVFGPKNKRRMSAGQSAWIARVKSIAKSQRVPYNRALKLASIGYVRKSPR